MNIINAIIGSTCSGKSALALKLANKFKLSIFSIDSLSVYKYIDIASAKPSCDELRMIKHYGINVLEPNEKCNAKLFFNLLKYLDNNKILIVGGSSFYLKSIIDGMFPMPKVNHSIQDNINNILKNKLNAYSMLSSIDKEYADKININDSYRIARGLEIFFLTNTPPSLYYKFNEKEKLPFKINIFELNKPKEYLVEKIRYRTKTMINSGLIDEAIFLRGKFKNSQTLKAIGIKEALSYVDGDININTMEELINKHTIALAKRQRTFNKTQFKDVIRGDEDSIINHIAY